MGQSHVHINTKALARFFFIGFVLFSPTSSNPVRVAPPLPWPAVMLWAWERPEDLRFIDIETTGVAFLDRTVLIDEDDITVQLRRQPLRVSPGAQLLPVVRVEVGRSMSSDKVQQHLEKTVRAILGAARKESPGVQVDFDATLSQRSFYRGLLAKLRAQLPADKRLSITALASWCAGDRWMANLPVDEIVPMLFEMGPEKLDGEAITDPRCTDSVGLSIHEPTNVPSGVRRRYFFAHNAWRQQQMVYVHKAVASD